MKYGVGIDVSKGKSTISILSVEGEVIEEPFEINHDLSNLDLLNKKLSTFLKEDLKIVLEQTGTYHLPILTYLLDKGYCVIAENPLKIKKYLDRNLRKAKNDKKDSLKLAEYCCDNWYKLKPNTIEEEKYKELRFLSRQYFTFNDIKVKQKNDLSNLCDLVFPGYYQLLNENNFLLGIIVFKKYNNPRSVKNIKEEKFYKEIDKIAQKRGQSKAGKTLAINIYKLAKETYSLCPSSKITQPIIDRSVAALILSIETTNEIITNMSELAKSMYEYIIVRNMDGVGEKLAPLLIAEIGDIRRFKNAGSLIAYTGIDAPPYQSGKFEAVNRHISKRGNKYLRRIGYTTMKAVKTFCKSGTELYDYIVQKENEGKSKKSSKIAGLNKFLRQYYGKVRNEYIEIGIW